MLAGNRSDDDGRALDDVLEPAYALPPARWEQPPSGRTAIRTTSRTLVRNVTLWPNTPLQILPPDPRRLDLVITTLVPEEGTVTNMFGNPSLEIGASAWAGGARDNTKAYQGDWSYLSTDGNSEATVTRFNLAANTTYTVLVHLWIPSTKTNDVVTRIGGGSALPPYNTAPILGRDEWVSNSTTFTTVNAGFIVCYPGLSNSPSNPSDDPVWSDAVMLTEGGTLYPYFDGDTPDTDQFTYSWVGTPNDSASERYAIPSSYNAIAIASQRDELRMAGVLGASKVQIENHTGALWAESRHATLPQYLTVNAVTS